MSSTELAEASIARDSQEEPRHNTQIVSGDHIEGPNDSDPSAARKDSLTIGFCNQSSSIASTAPATLRQSAPSAGTPLLTKQGQGTIVAGEESFFRDHRPGSAGPSRRDSHSSIPFSRCMSLGSRRKRGGDEESALSSTEGFEASETTALLGHLGPSHGGECAPENTVKGWQEVEDCGKNQKKWQQEAKVLAKYSRSLILTCMLQYSLPIASIFSVGHIGKIELGAVSLASMTANITGYAVYQGLATSLDTLCAQAYGSGNKKLVGLQMQRMVYFLWVMTIPIGIVWLAGTQILEAIVPEKEIAALAGLYLKIVLAGAPGYAAFESGKSFVQAQGLFSATLYVLLVCAPLNAFLNWLFVWVCACGSPKAIQILILHQQLGWGFVGAPVAVTFTANLMPICLFLYVRFVGGMECWGGFSMNAFKNWGPMVRLALPGLIMVLAEYLAFEFLTLAASWISTTHLAAQSVLSTLAVLACQVAFPLSISASTRIANLIGATLSNTAKVTASVSLIAACCVGLSNMIILNSLRNHIPWIFTNDTDVADLVAKVLPLCAAMQLFDALAANCSGILRGLGKQAIGGWVGLFSYYVVGLPISLGTGFGLHWDLYGFWAVSKNRPSYL
jgi:multidrug resistance protein, MATE family